MRSPRFWALAAVAFTLANAGFAGWDQGETLDERFHLQWSQRLLEEGVDERWSAFRLDTKTPAYLPAAALVRVAPGWRAEGGDGLRKAGRLWAFVLYGTLLATVFHAVRLLDGDRTAWIALALVALEPNLAAAASVATTDGPYALTALLVCTGAMVGNPMLRALAVGAALGLAFAVKFAAPLLAPVVLGVALLDARDGGWRAGLRSAALSSSAFVLTTAAAYMGEGLFVPLSSIRFQTEIFRTFQGALPDVRLPIPRAVLTGLDMSMHHDRGWFTYAFGRAYDHPVPWYFLAHALLKTPVALVLATLFGLWQARRVRASWVLLWAAVAFLHAIYFSFFFRTQIGYRFVLVCLPLLLCVAARGWVDSGRPALIGVVTLLALAERGPYAGDPLAFTSALVQPKSRAWWFTGDSNLDWGQNRARLRRELREARIPEAVVDPPALTSGPTVLSAHHLTVADRRGLAGWLWRERVPVRAVGFTHFEFSLDAALFERYMDDLRLARFDGNFADVCSGPSQRFPPGARIPIERIEGPVDLRTTLVCVSNRRGGDVGLFVDENRAWFGRLTPDRACVADLVQQGEQAWFRLAADAPSVLCIVEQPFRRAFLRYELRARIALRGRGADIAVRPADDLGIRLMTGPES